MPLAWGRGTVLVLVHSMILLQDAWLDDKAPVAKLVQSPAKVPHRDLSST